jgi:ubiquinone/menaquinone biosynthesis C-methylase UbiE
MLDSPVDVDTSSRDEFVAYYEQASLSEQTLQRYGQIQDLILRSMPALSTTDLDVADIGCGAGTQAMMWAERGSRVRGLDVNERLITLARTRAAERQLDVSYVTGTATDLPWDDASADVCILPELLEHVAAWQRCLSEGARILRPGGVMYLSTTNRLCPVQQEFNLPMYSWYPSALKRHCEKLAVTTRPDLANHATYPAVNWFSYGDLSAHLAAMGFDCLDRFQTAPPQTGTLRRAAIGALKGSAAMRTLAQVFSPYTQVLAIKRRA